MSGPSEQPLITFDEIGRVTAAVSHSQTVEHAARAIDRAGLALVVALFLGPALTGPRAETSSSEVERGPSSAEVLTIPDPVPAGGNQVNAMCTCRPSPR